MTSHRVFLAIAVLLSGCAGPHTCPGFAFLPDAPGGPVESYASDISEDGHLVAGESRTEASAASPHGEGVRWSCTKWSGTWEVETVGFLKGAVPYSPGFGISTNGQVIVGASNLGASVNQDAGYAWRWGAPLTVLPPLGQETFARADACDDAGRFAVGSSAPLYSSNYAGTRAVIWRATAPPSAPWQVALIDQLPDAPGESRANDLVLVPNTRFRAAGWAQSVRATAVPSRGAVGHEAVSWDLRPDGRATGRVWLGFLGDPKVSRAYGLSRDGRIIVGMSAVGFIPGDPNGNKALLEHPIRWHVLPQAPSAVTLTDDLGVLPGCNTGAANAVSDDGDVVVGQCSRMSIDSSGELAIEALDSFVWDPTHGMRAMRDVLDSLGETQHHGWTLYDATGISKDGRWVCGNAYNDETFEFAAWVADIGRVRVKEPPFVPNTPKRPPIEIWGPILERRR